jgi:ubiquinone/menaquinone biosynthesis C-methylase UbiE
VFERLVAIGDLQASRVLDVGCGTGAFAAALVERGARVCGVDPSAEMLAQAAEATDGMIELELGRAEALPFEDASFDRVVFRLVIHLVDLPRALREAARVLVPEGRIVIATFGSEHFEGYWLNAFFPEIHLIDRARFATPAELATELAAAGFDRPRTRTLRQRGELSRAEALERIRGRFISTLRLLDEAGYARGLARAERGLPNVVEFTTDWAFVVADRR